VPPLLPPHHMMGLVIVRSGPSSSVVIPCRWLLPIVVGAHPHSLSSLGAHCCGWLVTQPTICSSPSISTSSPPVNSCLQWQRWVQGPLSSLSEGPCSSSTTCNPSHEQQLTAVRWGAQVVLGIVVIFLFWMSIKDLWEHQQTLGPGHYHGFDRSLGTDHT